jgi:hypothetical protein
MKSSLCLILIFGLIFVMSVPIWAEEIDVCYNTRNGVMRYVESPSDCRRNENPLILNMEGPAGSDGIDGINCWDLNGNGVCDLISEDTDTDEDCDVFDCQGPEGPPGPTGGFDPSKIYTNYCGGTLFDGIRPTECLCDEDGSKAISGAVSCWEFRYPISLGPYTDPSDGTEGWTALCKSLIDYSQAGPEVLSVTCIRP